MTELLKSIISAFSSNDFAMVLAIICASVLTNVITDNATKFFQRLKERTNASRIISIEAGEKKLQITIDESMSDDEKQRLNRRIEDFINENKQD